MLLLVDARKLGDKPSGIGMYIYNYINNMLNYKDIKIILISDIYNSNEIKQLKKQVFKTYEYGKHINKNFEVIKYSKYIQNIINETQPDVFWEPNNIIPIKLKNPYGKILVTIHDIFPISNGDEYSIIYKSYFKYSLKKTIMSADAITCVSEFTLNELRQYYNNKLKNKKVFVSYNIVDFIYNNCQTNKNYFLYVGNIEKRKGVDILLDAYDRYKLNGGEKGLHIAGAIRDTQLETKINMLKNKYKDFVYLGYVSLNEKSRQLYECSAFIFPSRAEGFGIPPVEALSYGKQVIVSDLDIFKEILCSSVEMFEMDYDYNKVVCNLANKMMDYRELVNKEQICNLLKKYSGHVVADKFVNKINRI